MNENNEKMDVMEVLEKYIEKIHGREPDGGWNKLIVPLLGGGFLDSMSYYQETDGRPHWHYIAKGFNELFDSGDNDDPTAETKPAHDIEMTFRLLQKKDEQAPSQWPFRNFENFAANMENGNFIFKPYDYIEFGGMLDTGEKNAFPGALVVPDTEMPELKTPKKIISFLQLVPLTQSELDILKEQGRIAQETQSDESYDKAVKDLVAELQKKLTPLLITDLSRT